MTNHSPITVPDGTRLQVARAKSTKVEAQRWDYFGRADRFVTTIELGGDVTIDLTKPIYILQFEDEGSEE